MKDVITMKFQIIRNCGKLGIEFLKDDSDGARVTKELLSKLLTNVVKRATAFYDKTRLPGDHIFAYREQQFHSVVCPSIADITPSYVMEHSLRRKHSGEEESAGRADYWVNYRNYSFLMELKHDYFAYNRKRTSAGIVSNFNSAMDQLRSIKKDECRNLTVNKGLIKIALQTIVFYESSEKKLSRSSSKRRNFEELLNQLMSGFALSRKINMKSLWVLDKRLVEPFPYPNGMFEINPAVAFLANISDRI